MCAQQQLGNEARGAGKCRIASRHNPGKHVCAANCSASHGHGYGHMGYTEFTHSLHTVYTEFTHRVVLTESRSSSIHPPPSGSALLASSNSLSRISLPIRCGMSRVSNVSTQSKHSVTDGVGNTPQQAPFLHYTHTRAVARRCEARAQRWRVGSICIFGAIHRWVHDQLHRHAHGHVVRWRQAHGTCRSGGWRRQWCCSCWRGDQYKALGMPRQREARETI